MGLIQAAVAAAGGVLADQWKEYFYCDSITEDVLVVKGQKRVSGKSSNTKGSDNIISNGSVIAVNDGQCMIIVDQGKVAEICAEPGEFRYDSSTEPSIFSGSLGDSILDTFKAMGRRFTFGGDTGKDQRVYYFNTKEIVGNKYGTANAVPFRVVDNNIGLDIDISIKCFGEYSYKIVDPILFYTNVCGNVDYQYERSEIDSQLKTELLTALQPAFAKISEQGIRYSALPGHTTEIADALNEVLTKSWREKRGIAVASFGVSSVKASEEDEQMIKEAQRNAINRNPNMAAATLVGAQAQAMQDAAKNPNGSMMAFAGMNMAGQAGGMNAGQLFQMGQQAAPQAAPQPAAAPSPQPAAAPSPQPAAGAGWTCSCGTVNTGNFCSNCGSPKPQ
ncbi:MAG: SPFH domain-containing protein [Lachnospiraceae bacterium]|nr:SPFH domain-containing protein [Lachnospiraceae bacterium]